MLTNLSKSESLNLKFKDFDNGNQINDFVKQANHDDSTDYTVQILGVVPNGSGLTIVYLKHGDDGKLTY